MGLGIKNPYRYRGYKYDTEYYNPERGRFINADMLAGNTGELLSHNVYTYYKNNPIELMDVNGRIRLLLNVLLEEQYGEYWGNCA